MWVLLRIAKGNNLGRSFALNPRWPPRSVILFVDSLFVATPIFVEVLHRVLFALWCSFYSPSRFRNQLAEEKRAGSIAFIVLLLLFVRL